jgi:hypothetical protein
VGVALRHVGLSGREGPAPRRVTRRC